MRLAKLELLAFGHFRGLALDLGDPGKLSVVYGKNEAGKSTTLRAIAGLLYGIPHRTPDAHTQKDLRIGGVLVGDDGERVRVVRRKGVTNTLLDESGKPLDEALVLRLLRGVTEDTFKTAFALDHVTLRSGAQALLDGRGDLGESLFDASVGGGGDVQRLLRELGEEADAIYKLRGTTLPLNEALRAFHDAQKAIKDTQSLPDAFEKQQRAIDESVGERAAKASARASRASRRAELDRARRRVPLELRRARAAGELAALGAIAAHGAARVRAIEPRLAAYERDCKTRSELAVEAERLRERIADAARRARMDVPDKAKTPQASLRLDAGAERRIGRLVSDGAAIAARLDAASDEISRVERELARVRPATNVLADAREREGERERERERERRQDALARALLAARELAAAEPRHVADAARVAKRRREIEARVAALGLVTCGAEELAALRVPAPASVARLASRAAAAERAIASAAARVSALDAEAAAIEAKLAEHTGDFAPPDLAALRAARAARDAAWDALRSADVDVDADAKTRAARATEFERALAASDHVADRMIGEADRVTSIARLREIARANGAQREVARRELAAAERGRAALDDEHRELFGAAKIAPLGFAEMQAWLERRAQIVERVEEQRAAERDVEEEARALAAARGELASALALVGEEARDGDRLADLVACAARRVEAAASARREAESAAESVAKLEAQRDERRADVAKAALELEDVRARLADLVAPLGVRIAPPTLASTPPAPPPPTTTPPTTTTTTAPGASAGLDHASLPARGAPARRDWESWGDEISRALETLRDLFALVDRRAELEARAVTADRDARAFEEEVARAVADLAPDLAGVGARDAALALAERSRRAQALAQDIASDDAQLAELGRDPLPDDVAAIASDGGAALRAIDALDAELGELDRELQRLDQQIGALRNGMDRLKAESGAADASARAEEALARIRSNVERYARAKLACVLLAREVERYRDENQGPLLGRASQLFARLTAGAFIGVRAGFDEHDRAALACVRAGGADVGVGGLSEGTLDQLYLSLRLASLLRHAEISGPMPLVLDDVLIHFDDERARAALVALGEVASQMQILFFTHHARLVELAREALGPALVVHDLAPGLAPSVDQRQWM